MKALCMWGPLRRSQPLRVSGTTGSSERSCNLPKATQFVRDRVKTEPARSLSPLPSSCSFPVPLGARGVGRAGTPGQGRRSPCGWPLTSTACPPLISPVFSQVLKLLLVAWDRRLIFAIGTSSTTGESDTVIWNEVHHKTEFGSNLTGHGYPDANYLDNVLAELAAQGISEDSAAQEKD